MPAHLLNFKAVNSAANDRPAARCYVVPWQSHDLQLPPKRDWKEARGTFSGRQRKPCAPRIRNCKSSLQKLIASMGFWHTNAGRISPSAGSNICEEREQTGISPWVLHIKPHSLPSLWCISSSCCLVLHHFFIIHWIMNGQKYNTWWQTSMNKLWEGMKMMCKENRRTCPYVPQKETYVCIRWEDSTARDTDCQGFIAQLRNKGSTP